MKKLLFIIPFVCFYNACFATQCEPELNYLITDQTSCPNGYVNASSASGTKNCDPGLIDSKGVINWHCL